MTELKKLFLRYPNRSKYLLFVIDFLLVIIASKIFINYNNIKVAIDQTAIESEQKRLELSFTKNFKLPYEKSEYSEYFLKHENNILQPKEFIIKFQTITPAAATGDVKTENKSRFIENPKQSRKQFFYEKLTKRDGKTQ